MKIETLLSVTLVSAVGSLIGLVVPLAGPAAAPGSAVVTFRICHTGGGINCVVDGDTAWISGEKVRVADIDAPETHPPRCPIEAELGDRATRRLAELMSVAPFRQEAMGHDEDRYGRKLRVLVNANGSIGGQLVLEGLARPWDGKRRPWC